MCGTRHDGRMRPPTDRALAAFGISGEPELLPGGQGGVYAVDDAVLRPAGDPELAGWIAEVMSVLAEDGFRVPRPRLTTDGAGWVADGWTSWDRVAGAHRTWAADWSAALEV